MTDATRNHRRNDLAFRGTNNHPCSISRSLQSASDDRGPRNRVIISLLKVFVADTFPLSVLRLAFSDELYNPLRNITRNFLSVPFISVLSAYYLCDYN